MWGKTPLFGLVALVLAIATAGLAEARTTTIRPGPDAQVRLEQALAQARPGDVVRLRAGRYTLTRGLELTGSGVTLRGEGPDRTVLDFAGIGAPGIGISLSGSQAVVRDLAIDNAPGTAVSAAEVQQVSFINLQIGWATAGRPMAGLALLGSEFLVDRVRVRGPATHCLRLDLSTGALVQRSRFEGCTIGALITSSAQVHAADNQLVGNSIGLVFVDVARALGPSRFDVYLRRNLLDANNAANPNAARPNGLGVMIQGGQGITLIENTFADHGTAHMLITAQPTPGLPQQSPLPRDIAIVRNAFGDAGMAPHATLAALPRADVIWDGATQYVAGGQPRSEPVRIVFDGNASLRPEGAVFVNAGLNVVGVPWSEAQPTVGAPPLVALPPVTPWMPGERQARLLRR